jgi:hypothetical protein
MYRVLLIEHLDIYIKNKTGPYSNYGRIRLRSTILRKNAENTAEY